MPIERNVSMVAQPPGLAAIRRLSSRPLSSSVARNSFLPVTRPALHEGAFAQFDCRVVLATVGTDDSELPEAGVLRRANDWACAVCDAHLV